MKENCMDNYDDVYYLDNFWENRYWGLVSEIEKLITDARNVDEHEIFSGWIPSDFLEKALKDH